MMDIEQEKRDEAIVIKFERRASDRMAAIKSGDADAIGDFKRVLDADMTLATSMILCGVREPELRDETHPVVKMYRAACGGPGKRTERPLSAVERSLLTPLAGR